MDKQEAIDWLKGMQNKPMDYAEMVGAPAFAYGYKFVYPDPEDYAIDEAIDALEKQIAKKPIKVDSGVNDYSFDYECPNCRKNVEEDDHHCKCGQKLNWDEVI